ncbi:PIR Superfamily Protein [Plasmodium ovale wallikeri]|uniref:PIR Superfamily Protein n=1 Tax=Plasmodium ovale wallikeri TaxID=864142 RepID=A0A1A9AKH5_PLAOA|nr:PIR Superfamily Protein [Plasmodium ovale wallikeri]
MVGTEMPSRDFEEGVLPSNFYIKSLYKEKNLKKHIQQIEENKSNNNSVKIIPIINSKFGEIFQEIKEGFRNDDEIMCCRNISYYFDLLYAIIKSPSRLSNDITNNLLYQIEHKWNEVPEIKNKDECKGETDLDSTSKRCVLKHIHDLKMDMDAIKAFPEKYTTYLNEKWGKIIRYTNSDDKLYIKIENDFMGIIEKYNHFLLSPDFICDIKLDDLSTDDITISTNWDSLMSSISLEKFTTRDYVKGCYNKRYIDMLKNKSLNIQKMNNILSIGIAILGFSFILIFLYRFSPLSSFIHRYTKKKIELDENISNDVMSELYDNYDDGGSYVTYQSVSH